MSDIYSPTPLEILEFRGGPNDDVTAFLGAIKRVGVIQGRHSDDEWMVSYTESCLRGDAMEWFDEMSSEATPMDWRSLRKEFLRRFHRRDASPPPPPAAAAPGRYPIVQASTNAPLPNSVKTRFRGTQANGVFKILILGNSGVGKSCLLSRFLGHGWAPSMIPTVGIHHEVHNEMAWREDNKFTLEMMAFWDPSGTEHYYSLLAPYCRGTTSVWIIYDITDQKSFQDVRRWFNLVVQENPTAKPFMRLLANKRDLSAHRVIQEQQGRDLAKKLGAHFLELSAKTNEGVQDIRVSLGVVKKEQV
ncbi:GTP-binding protein [Tulasnella sp. JGI-2019a]|nr:GTP-binding protein [Tulasnella sp. JGI-2019a]KAG8995369.1 GTP-binding protein [Tulasnella sp. JGI-2019a]